jgi:hypothetical protein
MEQTMERLQAYQKIKAEMRAHWERLEALMDASLARMEACLGATGATVKASQEQMGAESKTGLEEAKATGLETNQEKIGAIAQHQEVPRGATHEKMGALEERYGHQRLAVRRHGQLKKLAQGNHGSRHEFAAAVGRWTCHAVPALHKGHGVRNQARHSVRE